jgi:hypothetical protein
MKSNKTKIVLGIILFIFISIFGGAYFYAKSQISPEKVREHTLVLLKKTFPKSQIDLGKVELGFGLAIKVDIQSLDISGPKGKLVRVENFKVKIPLFSILTGGGDLQVSLNSPTLHYLETRKSNNWTIALAKKTKKRKNVKKKTKKIDKFSAAKTLDTPATLAVPTFLLNSTLSVDVNKLNINYKLKDKSSGKLNIERVLLKKLGLKNASAYEVKSALNYKMKSGEILKLNALLIGQFNISEFISKGKLETVSELKLVDTYVPGIKKPLPEIKTKLNTKIGKKGKVDISVESSFLSNNTISLDIEMNKGAIKISKLKTELVLSDLFDILSLKIDSVQPGKSKVKLSGDIFLSRKGKVKPKLNFSVGPELTYIDKNFTTKTTLNGSLKNKSFKSKAEARVLDGVVVLQNSMKLDLNNPPSIKKLPKIFTLINVSNLTIKEGLIQDLVYSTKDQKVVSSNVSNKEKSSKTESEESKKKESLPLIPPGEVTIKMSNVKIDKEVLTLNSKILLSRNKIGIKESKFEFSKGKGSVEAAINLHSINRTSGSFKFDLKDFELKGLKPFLPKNVLKAVRGKFSGKTSGEFSMKGASTNYNVISSVSATNGEIAGINISDYIKPILLKVPKVGKEYASKIKTIDGKFESLSINGKFTQKKYHLKNFRFIGLGKKVDLKGKGYISPVPNSKSEVFVTYRDPSGKITKILKKEAGREDLPLKLKGKGFSLKPDINYTLNIVAKTAIEAQGKKELDKFLKKDSNKKKINKLLKGLFK